MNIKKFSCKTEEVPVIGEFLVSNAERDINDFGNYSSIFSANYFASVRSKIEVCKELVKSSAVSKELKDVTRQLYGRTKTLRVKLNAVEGYFKFGTNNLDIAVEDAGLKNVRQDITKHNVEGLLSNMQTVLTAVTRNLPVLEMQGLKHTLIDEIKTDLKEISMLNERQNLLMSKRNRLTVENIQKFNDLWSNLKLIMDAAKAIYRGVDEVKLKDYTAAQLRKRINAER
jgi:hypothetical protein